jgi:hypothetical protein
MPLYKFDQNDIFHNRIEAHPQCNFFIYSGSTYYNNRPELSGAFVSSVPSVPPGHINLYELNVDRPLNLDAAAVGTIEVVNRDLVALNDTIVLRATNGTIYTLTSADVFTVVHTTTPTFIPGLGALGLAATISALNDFSVTHESGTDTLTITQVTPGVHGNVTIVGGGTLESGTGAVVLTGFSGGTSLSYINSFINKNASSPPLDYKRPQYARDPRFEDRVRLIHAAHHPGITILTGSYPMSASIVKEYFHENHVAASFAAVNQAIVYGRPETDPGGDIQRIRPLTGIHGPSNWRLYGLSPKTTLGSKITALKNTLDSYIYLSYHYAFSSASLAVTSSYPDHTPPESELVTWDKSKQEIGLISIPSIIYGREIKKGTVDLKFYVSGTLVGELKDEKENGELVQVGPLNSPYSGSTAGLVLYNEGFLLLTGSWDLTAEPVVAMAELFFDPTADKINPANNDSVTLTDTSGKTVTFKFNTRNNIVNDYHPDGVSWNVGIASHLCSDSPCTDPATRFKLAVNAADIDMRAEREGRFVFLRQNTAGLAGNTDIIISSSYVATFRDPFPSSARTQTLPKFRGGLDGPFSPPHTENYIDHGEPETAIYLLSITATRADQIHDHTVGITDALGNYATFKFDADNSDNDGRLHEDHDSTVTVGIKDSTGATAYLYQDSVYPPDEGDTLTLTDAAGNEVKFRFSYDDDIVDGRLAKVDGFVQEGVIHVGISSYVDTDAYSNYAEGTLPSRDIAGEDAIDEASIAAGLVAAITNVNTYDQTTGPNAGLNDLTLGITATYPTNPTDPTDSDPDADTAITLTQNTVGAVGYTSVIFTRTRPGNGLFSNLLDPSPPRVPVSMWFAHFHRTLAGGDFVLTDHERVNLPVVNSYFRGPYRDSNEFALALTEAVGNVDSYSNGLLLNIAAENDSTADGVLLTHKREGLTGNITIRHTPEYKTVTQKVVGVGSAPRWIDFAQTIATGSYEEPDKKSGYHPNHLPSSSFELDFEGTSRIPTITMLAHARKGHLNFSNNSTYQKLNQLKTPVTGPFIFKEPPELEIKNIISSSYQDFTASYRRQTYISKIGIYDDKRNLIGVAKVATPVKKTEERDFTFKLKLDI